MVTPPTLPNRDGLHQRAALYDSGDKEGGKGISTPRGGTRRREALQNSEDAEEEIGKGNNELVDSQDFYGHSNVAVDDDYYIANDEEEGGFTDEGGLDLEWLPEHLHSSRNSENGWK